MLKYIPLYNTLTHTHTFSLSLSLCLSLSPSLPLSLSLSLPLSLSPSLSLSLSGSIFVAGVAWGSLSSGGWRLLTIITAIPVSEFLTYSMCEGVSELLTYSFSSLFHCLIYCCLMAMPFYLSVCVLCLYLCVCLCLCLCLCLQVTLSSLIAILLLPESPRWLITQGR